MNKFKRIYIEITNKCNLNCSFCTKDTSKKMYMKTKDFKHVVNEIKPYTKHVYLHVKGEPLLHPYLEQILKICHDEEMIVDLTTNGTLLEQNLPILKSSKIIHHINVSLHAETHDPQYLEKVFTICDKLSNKISISYRIWTLINGTFDEKGTEIVDRVVSHYKLSTEMVNKIYCEKNIYISSNISLNKADLFEWPNMNTNYYHCEGFCRGLSTHIAILVDGTVIPCCLDSKGINKLGNIFKESLDNIINKKETQEIKIGFTNGKVVPELCKHCRYKERFRK